MGARIGAWLVLLSLTMPAVAWCQNTQTDDSASGISTIAAGKRYQASGFHRFFLGKHYRDEWATPIQVPLLDFSTFGGGITPYKQGGGFQTKSLRFETSDGREYQFRSVDKDPKLALPPELRETIAADVVQDQISSAHPYGALVVPPLAEAVGVLHATPQVVLMPDDDRLGEYRGTFAGLLGMIEERPVDGPNGTAGFAGSDKIEGTDKLFEILAKEYDDFVDQKEFLKARLLDIYLSDWDRHMDQWRWARFRQDSKEIWQPIPRDRDQAFSQFDGLFPSLAEKRFVVPQLEGINKKRPDVFSLTLSGYHLDRMFLNELTEDDFQTASQAMVTRLTDDVIATAVRRLPPPIFDISGRWLEQKLRERRKLMAKVATDYYKNLASFPEIVGRNKDEFVEIDRSSPEHVDIKLYKRDNQSGEKEGEPLYHRVFKRNEAREIRLYLLGGDDKVMISGQSGKSIKLRIIGGPGADEIVDNSRARTIIYDTNSSTKIVKGQKTKFVGGEVDSVINAFVYKVPLPDYGTIVKPIPFLAYNSDDGVFVGAAIEWLSRGFRKTPYAMRNQIKGTVAFKTGAFRLGYNGDFVQAIGGLRFNIEANVDRPRVRNYYGLGNDTPRSKDLEKGAFYEIRSKEALIRPLLHHDFSPVSSFFFGAGFRRFSVDSTDNTNTLLVEEKPYGLEINNTLELTTGIKLDYRDNPIMPSKGSLWDFGVSYIPKAFDNDSAYTRGRGMVRLYYSPLKILTLAAGVSGVKLWGSFPYYDAAYIGGISTLRGFARDRFAGEASVDGVVAGALKLFRYYFLFPTDFGVFAFGDAGRVWLDDESPGDWHTSFGSGVYLSPIFRELTLSIGGAQSAEGLRISISGGFRF